MISNESLQAIHIFFPDPWPKKKHHKRRLISPDFLFSITRKLKPSGYLHIVTDWMDYGFEIYNCLMTNSDLVTNGVEQKDIIYQRPSTKFEKKAIDKGHLIKDFVVFKKNP